MNKTFRISLLYLLLIIPQHGNSPIPRMESWVEMDQGDGFVDRDMTSSLTGAESFGSAHKNYQNALIRQNQENVEGELSQEEVIDKFSGGIPDRVQRRATITPNIVQNQFASYGYDNAAPVSVPHQGIYQEPVSGINAYQDRRCQLQLSNSNGHASNSKFDKRFYGSGLTDLTDSPLARTNARALQTDSDGVGVEDEAPALRPRLAKCSVGEPEKFDPEGAAANVLLNREDGPAEIEYATASEEMPNRMKSGLNEEYVTGMVMEDGDEGDRDMMRFNRVEDALDTDETDYYGEGRYSASARDDAPDNFETEYSQINPNRVIYKREEKKNGDAKIKSAKESRSEMLLRAEAPKEGREIAKVDDNGKLRSSNAIYAMSSDAESKDAEKALRNSRRALQDMETSQEKSEAKPETYREGASWIRDEYGKERKRNLQEKRNKREDEDEQKNMKTGTDEGGGEYEDEEGKGHNDEEEYYEEGELSTGEIASDHNSNRKFYKRETGKDEEEKGKKEEEENDDVSSGEYQLNLANAPVEHEENYKKCSWREGKSKGKSVARRGMKIWDEWGKWSPCSVTCGVGRKTRWRHCIGGGCARGEKEALIKKCTFPAC